MSHKYRATDTKDQEGIYVTVNRQHLRNLERIASKSEILRIKAENEELKTQRKKNDTQLRILNFINDDCASLSDKIIGEVLEYRYESSARPHNVFFYSSIPFENLKELVEILIDRTERNRKEIESAHKIIAKQSEELARLKREPSIPKPKPFSWSDIGRLLKLNK